MSHRVCGISEDGDGRFDTRYWPVGNGLRRKKAKEPKLENLDSRLRATDQYTVTVRKPNLTISLWLVPDYFSHDGLHTNKPCCSPTIATE